MVRKVLVILAGCALLASWNSAASGKGNAACTPGLTTIGGAKALVFCGKATATAKAGPQKLSFVNGRCEVRQKYMRIDLGTKMLVATTDPKPAYFGLTIGRTPGSPNPAVTKDGTYKGAVIAIVYGGVDVVPEGRGTVTLKAKRTKGSFSIKVASTGQLVTGSFIC